MKRGNGSRVWWKSEDMVVETTGEGQTAGRERNGSGALYFARWAMDSQSPTRLFGDWCRCGRKKELIWIAD